MKTLIKNIILPLRVNLKQPILVYQMGKVASTSIFESLKANNDLNVFHIHRLHPDNIEKVKQEHLRRGMEPQNERLGLQIYKKITKPKRPAKIISLIREPIGRNISAFFQNLDAFGKKVNAHLDMNVDDLISNFLKYYSHDVPLSWFDTEIKNTTDIDVYREEFPKELGYKVYTNNPFKLLLMKYDLNDHLKEKLLCDFLNIRNLKIVRANVGTSKNYSETYKDFLDKIKLPQEYIETMLSSKYAQHFFTAEELQNTHRKWIQQ